MIFNVEELLTQGEECPEGWTSLTGGCYKFLTGKRNWTEAKEECEKLPGWLVEIESEEQNDALYDEAREQKIGSSAWIGLSDTAKEGQWIWSSGETATFLNWTPQSPSNTRMKINKWQGEDCAVINLGEKTIKSKPWTTIKKWNDGSCEDTRGAAICQYKSGEFQRKAVCFSAKALCGKK